MFNFDKLSQITKVFSIIISSIVSKRAQYVGNIMLLLLVIPTVTYMYINYCMHKDYTYGQLSHLVVAEKNQQKLEKKTKQQPSANIQNSTKISSLQSKTIAKPKQTDKSSKSVDSTKKAEPKVAQSVVKTPEAKVDQAKSEQAKSEQVKKEEYSIEKVIMANKNSRDLSQDVLHLALKAYYNAASEDNITNHKLTIIDYSMPSNKKRMWLVDMDKQTIDLNTYVSHGVRSGDKYAKNFSNRVSSHMSSIGVMKTGSIYTGKSGMSLHLHGLENKINSNVYNRHVVIHGSNYVNSQMARFRGKVGKSYGCPAVDHRLAKTLIRKIANGSLVFAYYPLQSWLKSSEYLA